MKTAIVIALAITLLSLTVHVISPSTFDETESSWDVKLELHRQSPAFKGRLFTTHIVSFAHEYLQIPAKTAFLTLQFLLMVISGPVFRMYLHRLGFSAALSNLGMVVYLLSLPVFMAHFEPIHTWSDFWVYLLVPLALRYALEGRAIATSIAILAAILARETTLMFLPIWALLLGNSRGKTPTIVLSAAILAAFLIIRYIVAGSLSGGAEWNLTFNFASPLRTSDTLFSLIVSLGFAWVAGWYQLLTGASGRHTRWLVFGAILTTLGYVTSTLLLAHARETRLFFPPFVFLIPLTLLYIERRADVIKRLWSGHSPSLNIVAVAALLVLCTLGATALFPKFEYRQWADGNRVYLGVHLTLVMLFGLVEWFSRRQARGESTAA